MSKYLTRKNRIIWVRINLKRLTKIMFKISIKSIFKRIIRTTKPIFHSLITKKYIYIKNKHLLQIIAINSISEWLKINQKEKTLKDWLEKILLRVQQQVNFINRINLKKMSVQFMSLHSVMLIQMKLKNWTLVSITFISF